MEMMNHYQHMYDLCRQHMHSYVLAELNDGAQFDGIITGLDGEYVYMAIPVGCGGQMPYGQQHAGYMPYGQMQPGMPYMGQMPHGQSYSGGYQYHDCHQRDNDIGGFGYGYPGYGYGPGYGYNQGYGGYGRRGRFHRLVLPLAALTALTALPWY